jgi:hypothetical protein
MSYNILIPILLALCFTTSCQSSRHRTVDNVYWVYGHPFPWVAFSIKQTNVETNFFGSVDLMVQNGLRSQLRRKDSVTIDPIAMWIVFSYPAKTRLAIETAVHEDASEMSGWVLAPDGSFRESNNTNKMLSILVRQKDSDIGEATVRLTMLLQIENAGSTNLTTAMLPCIWHDGTLENRGLRLLKESKQNR